MLYLIGEKELNYVFDGGTCKEIIKRGVTTYKNRPGFFTPYRNIYEFAGELIAPVFYPLHGTLLAGATAIAAVISGALYIGASLVALGASLFHAPEFKNNTCKLAGFSLYCTGWFLIISAASALLALISIPHSLASLVTRSVSTLVNAGSESARNESVQDNPEDEDEMICRCI